MRHLTKKRQIRIERAAPVLNTSDFSFAFGGLSGNEIPLNEKGHPHCFEWVALEGMEFEIGEECPIDCPVYRIICPHYTSSLNFIDARFTGPAAQKLDRKERTYDEILSEMKTLIGTPYVWGGNWSFGIPELLKYYPPKRSIDSKTEIYWTMKGVDCSGLLFQTTRGATPRNTSELLHFGQKIDVDPMSIEMTLRVLRPLDMIIYPGHVLFVFDSSHTIESKYPFGVILRSLKERLEELLLENRAWTLRRWI